MKTTRLLVTLIALLGVWQRMFAENQAYAVLEGNNYDLLKFYYDGNKPASGAYDIPWDPTNNPGWKDYYMYITKVVFDNSFSNYHGLSSTANMFYKLERLTTIEGISNLNTENVTDMSNMFSGCYILNSLDLSNFNTSNVTNMSGMFQDCRLLTSFDLSNFNTSNVTDMSNMFSGCNISLTSLDLSNFNTSSVTNMSGMFYNCLALTEIIFSEANTTNVFNTSNVTDMSGMFYYCSALTSLDVSYFNTSSVTNMSQMFAECESLTSLDVSNFSTSSVTNMSQMFYSCLALTEILFSKANTTNVFNTSNVTDMSGMFYYCSALTSFDVSNFNTSSVTDMSHMFAYCSALTSLDVSNFNTSSVTNMLGMFENCNNLEGIIFSNENTDYVFKTESVTDMSYMFARCIKLKNIDISHFTTSNVEDMSNMFEACKELKNLDFSNFNTEKVTSMSSMFSQCQELKNLDLSNFDVSAVSSMNSMFNKCTGLETIDIRNFTKTENTSAIQMFNNCENLKEIICLNTWNDSNSSQIFNGCSKLKGGNGTTYSNGSGTYAHPDGGPSNPGYFTDAKPYAILSNGTLTFYFDLQKSERVGQESTGFDFPTGNNAPDWTALEVASTITTVTFNVSYNKYIGLTSTKSLFSGLSNPTTINNLNYLHTDCVTNMSHMFDGCIGLTSLDLSNFSTNNVTDMSYMFSGCSSLTGLGLTNFNTSRVTDMSNMFSGCSSLTSLNLSDLNTEKVTDISYMFAGCEDLESLVLPNFYSEDYNSAHLTNTSHLFNGCSSLTSIDVSKINTEYVTDMSYMFNGCSSLTSLDLNNFYIPNATNLSYMFNGCSSLENINCSYDWAQYGKVTPETSEDMFAGCVELPNFNSNEVTVAKANPRDGGYFSAPPMAYAYLNNHKLIFRYDDNYINLDYALELQEDEQYYLGEYFGNNVIQVIFEPSFRAFSPTSTANWFAQMQNLESITGLENLNTEAVSDMHSMFYYCYNLTSLDLTSFDVSKVTDMSYMFAYCSSLEMIYAEDWSDIERDEYFSSYGMFAGCEELPGYDEDYSYDYDIDWAKPTDDEGVGFFSTRSVYAIVDGGNLTFHYDGYYDYFADDEFDIFTINETAGGTWKNATFTTVTFDPSFADYKLTSTAEMFSGKTGLTTINGLDNLNTTSITDMSYMFSGCSSLTTIYCSKDWSGLDVTSSDGMFAGCTSLVGAISYDNNKTDITYANPYDGYFSQLPQAYAVQEGSVLTFYYDNRIDTHSDAITYEIPWLSGGIEGGDEGSGGGYPGWINFGDEEGGGLAPARKSAKARTANEDITLVVFDPSFKNYHELNSTANMFYRMGSLTSIEGLENLNTENVTTMLSMFEGCSSLTSLDLTSFNTESVSTMESMFRGCSRLTSLDLTSFNTESVTTMESIFRECSSLRSINLASFNTEYVTTFHAMFEGCSGLTSLNLSNFNTGQAYQLWSMFQDCSSLTTLDLTNFDMTNVTDVDEVFFNCTSLETIFCNDDWSSKSYEYSSDIFWNCVSLKGSNGTDLEYFLNDDEPSYISYARPDEGPDAPGFFTPLSEGKIILYDSSTNTNTISNNNNKTVDVYFCERKLYKDGDWNTLCLPFNVNDADANDELTFSGTPLEGATVMTLSQNGTGFEDGVLSLNFVPATSVEAGKPYIVKWEVPEETDEYYEPEVIINPTFTDVTIQNVSESEKKIVTEYVDFVGNFNPFSIGDAGDKTKLYLGAENGLHYPNGKSTFYGFRAYFQLKGDLTAGEGEGASQIKAINLNFGDEENGIKEITTDSNPSNLSNPYFTLDGLRLLSQPATPGIYIHNGRKVMIK